LLKLWQKSLKKLRLTIFQIFVSLPKNRLLNRMSSLLTRILKIFRSVPWRREALVNPSNNNDSIYIMLNWSNFCFFKIRNCFIYGKISLDSSSNFRFLRFFFIIFLLHKNFALRRCEPLEKYQKGDQDKIYPLSWEKNSMGARVKIKALLKNFRKKFRVWTTPTFNQTSTCWQPEVIWVRICGSHVGKTPVL
jgi:hypothetical protein